MLNNFSLEDIYHFWDNKAVFCFMALIKILLTVNCVLGNVISGNFVSFAISKFDCFRVFNRSYLFELKQLCPELAVISPHFLFLF